MRIARMMAIWLFASLVLMGGLLAAGIGHETAECDGAGIHGQNIVVQPGDTLWSIAIRCAPQSDPRMVVEQIRMMNSLKTANIFPGQELILPG